MTNHFTHKQSWPEAKARIADNLATMQAVLALIAKGFDCPLAADTLAAMANVNRLTTPSQQGDTMTNNFNLADAIANIIRYKLDPGDIDSSLTDSEILAIQHLNAAYGALMAND